MYDLSEAPRAYKNIDAVIEAEQDLIEPIVKLRPLGVVKG
jgi:tRNA-splicing ligase RtcB